MTIRQTEVKTTEPTNQLKTYRLKGTYFGQKHETIETTHFYKIGASSMLDHQRMWYNDAQAVGYKGGEINEAETIRTNFNGYISEEEIIAIVNDHELMSTPLNQLFPDKLKEYLSQLRKLEE